MSCCSRILSVFMIAAPLILAQSPARGPSVQERQCLASALPLLQRRALQSAETALAACQQQYPQSAILANALGIVYEQEGRKTDAAGAFEKALVLLPSFTAAQIHLGTIYAGDGKCADAKRLFADAAANTADSGALVALGIGFAQCHDLAKSIPVLERALQSDPGSTAALYNLALAHYENHDFETSLKILDSLPGHQQEETADVLYLRGKILQALGDRPASGKADLNSAAMLSRACRLSPREDYCAQAALELIHHDESGQATSLIEGVIPKVAPSVPLLSALGLARFLLGRYSQAIDSYSKAIKLDPSLAAPREGLGFLLYMTGDLTQARSVVEKGLSNSGSEFYLRYLRALILYRQSPDLREEALNSVSASIKQNPAFAPAYFLRGKIRANQNDPVAALQDFQAAVRIDPMYPLPYYRMARIYSQQGRTFEAAAAARQFSLLGSSREDDVLAKQAKQRLERN